MSDSRQPGNPLVASYLELRTSVGLIGIALPLVLVVGRMLLQHGGILSSISAYYYSIMSGVFVGSLCAIGVFLWSYRGYSWADALLARVAALAAVGIALFPTTPDIVTSPLQKIIGGVHLAFAFTFFSILIYFALVQFRKTRPDAPPTSQKLKRNRVYVICGYTMLVCIILLILVHLLPPTSPLFNFDPVFWLEVVLIESFGISWLVKGEAILKDR